MNALIWILSSCVLILAVLLIRALFGRRLRPGLRYALWALVLVRLLVPGSFWTGPVSVETPVSRTELGQDLDLLREVDTVTRTPEGNVSGASARPVPGRGQAEQSVVIAQDVTPERFERLRSTLSLRNAAETVWVTGSVAAALIFAATNVKFYVNLRRRRRRLDLDAPVKVYEAAGLASSCLFLNSIYVNSETAADPLRLRHVLAHELSHRRHLDGLWCFARCAALTIHWFNPLVWLAASASRQDSELLADAGALRRLGEEERESYGGTLISLSVHAPRAVSPLCAATAMAGGKKSLKERVEHIARRPRATLAALLAVALIAGIAVGCTFAGAAFEGGLDNKGGEAVPDATAPGGKPEDTAAGPSGAGPALPTEDLSAFESPSLGVSILYPTEWKDLCAMTEAQLPEDYAPGGEGYVPCVAVALWGELLALLDAPGDYVLGPAVAYLYWSPAGEPGPESESGRSVTLCTAGDGSELRCYLPMTTKLNWTGIDAGEFGRRVYDACDKIERDILAGALKVNQLPQTPSIAAFGSEALDVALLFPADWTQTVTLSDSLIRGGLFSGLSDPLPCVRVDLREDVFGVPPYDAMEENIVYDNAVAFVYWLPAGTAGPEAESGRSVTLYTDGDGSELRAYLPMNAKLNWIGMDAGPEGERVFNAYDAIERGILEGKLTCRSIKALRQVASLPVGELMGLYIAGGSEFALTELIDRFVADPGSFLPSLAREPEEVRSFIAGELGKYMSAWYPDEARSCFAVLASETLAPDEAALLDDILSAFGG